MQSNTPHCSLIILQITELSQIILWVFIVCPQCLSHSARLSLYSALMRVLDRASHFMSSCPQEQTEAKDLFSVVRCLPRSLCICLSSVLPCENVIIRSRVRVCSSRNVVLTGWFDGWLGFHTEKGHVKKLELKRSFSIWRFAAFRVEQSKTSEDITLGS